MGDPKEVRAGRGEFHENPSTCICENSKEASVITSNIQPKVEIRNGKGSSSSREPTENLPSDEESEWKDLDYGENTPLASLPNGTDREYDLLTRSEVPDLEEMLSD